MQRAIIKCTKIRLGPDLRPGHACGSLHRSQNPLSQLGRGTPLRRLDLGTNVATTITLKWRSYGIFPVADNDCALAVRSKCERIIFK